MMTSPSSGHLNHTIVWSIVGRILGRRWTATEDGDVKLKLFWEIAIRQNDSASVVLLIIVILIMN